MEGSSSNNRGEAERWLMIAEKLLNAQDFQGTKAFAIRARESDPRLYASDQILAVAETLIAGESRINFSSESFNWYAILQLPHITQNLELIASQYRKLAMLLNPVKNRFAFVDQAFGLVAEAWETLSNPYRKHQYDSECHMSLFGERVPIQLQQLPQQPPPPLQPQQPQQPIFRPNPIRREGRPVEEEARPIVAESLRVAPQIRLNRDPESQVSSKVAPQSNRETEPRLPSPVAPETRLNREIEPRLPSPLAPETRPNRETEPQIPGPVAPETRPNRETEPQIPGPVALETRPNSEIEPQIRSPVAPEIRQNRETESDVPGFWTACPYCYYLYEYPRVYEDCSVMCQNCERAFQAVVILSPPVTRDKDAYFCSWGFFPVGFLPNDNGGSSSIWTPFSAMFACPGKRKVGRPRGFAANGPPPGPRVYYDDDDDVYLEISDEEDDSDDDWQNENRKKAKNLKSKAVVDRSAKKAQQERQANRGNQRAVVEDGNVVGAEVRSGMQEGLGRSSGYTRELNQNVDANNTRRQKGKGSKDLGQLDLNVEFSNDVEEPVRRMREGHGEGNGEEDNIEGIGFFEGLDEFLSSLPILVENDKVKAS